MDQQNLLNFLNEQSASIEELETAGRLAWWNLATTGESVYAQSYQQYNTALRQHFSSKTNYKFLSTQKSPDPLIQRQRDLLFLRYQENQIDAEHIGHIVALETKIEESYTNFRPELEGKVVSANELKEVFLNSQDINKRKQAWQASKEIGKHVQASILELVKLRNQSAVACGFSDYYTMRLVQQEINPQDLARLTAEVEQLTNPLWKDYKTALDQSLSKKFHISEKELQPWHYQDPFFQEAPASAISLDQYYAGCDIASISKHFYHDIGLAVDDILRRSDLYERSKKNQHAFCTCIDQAQDVRILCNLKNNEYWMGTQLHELGHAVYDKYIDQSLPYLLRTYSHICTTEAIAMLFGRLSKNVRFIQQYCQRKDVKEESAIKQQLAQNLLVFARWTLVMIEFEKAMYQQPDADLNTLWWDLVEKFQGVKRVCGRHAPDWAAKLHLACAPVYYQNYLLGELIASQLNACISHQFLQDRQACFPKEGASWLKDKLFALGAKYNWQKTVELVTEEPLNPRYFADDLKTH